MSTFKQLEDMLFHGEISRRDFIARVSALGLTAALSPVFFSSPAKASTPKKGGRLTIGVSGASTSDSMDPTTFAEFMSMSINWQIRNNLVEVSSDFEAVPELAESWEAKPGAREWVFNLRKGVEFHNGKSLEANDVIFSLNHHRGEKSKSGAKVIVQSIEDIKADGKLKVIITLKNGNADFPFLMADYHLPIMPADTKDFNQCIGTGGYSIVDYKPGVRAFTKRNPNYWKKGRAHFDEIETMGINDMNSRTVALKTGQIDVMNQCDRKTAHLLKKTPDIDVYSVNGLTFTSFTMLTDISPYDNNDVRMALKYATDRKELVDKVLRGYGAIGNDHPISPIMKYHASDLAQRSYDPDKARYHIKKAGMENHTFQLHTADTVFGGAIDAAILYQEQAAKAGIKIEVVREPDDGYWSNVWLKKPWCSARWNGRATEDWMFSVAFAANAAWNDSHFKNNRFNELLIKARVELDETKRHNMYAEMQKTVNTEGGSLIPMFIDYVEAASKKLSHGKLAGDWDLDGCRLGERWWFNS